MNFGRLVFIASLSTVLLPFGASQCLAQADFESLEKEIQEQRLLLEKQNQRLEELERMLQEAKAGAAGPGDDSKAQTPTLAAEEKKDQKDSTRPNVLREPDNQHEAMADANFPKSVPLFGSDWRFSFGGYVKADLITDFAGTGDPYQFTTATIPVPGAPNSPPRGGYTKLHARESRFSFEMRNSNEDEPFTRVFFEFDFFEYDSPSPRLRHAYFQYGDWIAGQTWTTLSELRSLPFLVDFSYGDALYGGRAFLVRYQPKGSDRFDWAVALEDFNTVIENPYDLTGTERSWTPQLAAKATYKTEGALFTLGGSLAQLRWARDMGLEDAHGLQWALSFGTRIYLDPGHKSYFGLDSSYGDGTAYNIISLAEGNVPGAVLRPDGQLETLAAWNIAPSFHIQLTDKLSTNLAYAWAQVESSSLRDPYEMEGDTAWHFNLIHDITEHLRVGGEYMYATRKNVNGDTGHANRVQFMVMYSF